MKTLARVLAVLLSVCGFCPAGTLYFAQDSNSRGLYRIDTQTGHATLVGAGHTGVSSTTVGLAAAPDGKLFGTTYEYLTVISRDGSGAVVLPGDTRAEGLEYVESTGLLYGIYNRTFFTIDTVTGSRLSFLNAPDADIEGLAHAKGTIYGIESYSGDLYAYDLMTGAWSNRGPTGVNFILPGLAYDSEAGFLYAIGAQDPNLYRISLLTGLATAVGNTGIQGSTGGGLAYVVPEPSTSLLVVPVLFLLASRARRRPKR